MSGFRQPVLISWFTVAMHHRVTRDFDIYPRIVRARSAATVAIRPLFDHCRWNADHLYEVTIFPAENAVGQVHWGNAPPILCAPTDGVLRIAYHFDSEQEYIVRVRASGDEPRQALEFRLYALEADLFARRPYKGDTHLHSCRSDGRESPAYVAAACRRIGLDFMAITDHRLYAPSLEAARAFSGLALDLRIYPGEEVHPPDNRVHIVNFGGRFSISELFETPEYRAGVAAIEARLTDFPAGVDRYPYASCVWCFDQIRQAGGLGIFCHPYWFYEHRYDLPQTLCTLLFERQPYDALELIGGYQWYESESNSLQVARYCEERAHGRRIPIVGASDAHGCDTGELFGWFYTIVFAPTPELPDLIAGIKELYSVAVEARPGEVVRVYGPFRLVKYAHFLIREVLPLHDELCFEEGRVMLAYLAGEEGAAETLRSMAGRTARLYEHLWQR
ncbi:MAG: hypothetical protein N2508_08405 [Anaerolineae bacterium]|nr:hypothetical protein [Anaerolineae bacterium]